MESTTTTVTTTHTTRVQPAITCDVGYVRTIRGILKIVQCVLCFICFICSISDVYRYAGPSEFLQFVAMTCFLITLTLIIFYMTKVIYRIPIPWIIAEFFYCCGAVFFLILASSILAGTWGGQAASVDSAVAFGFFAVVPYGIEAFFLIRDWKGGIRTPESVTTHSSSQRATTEVVVTETKQEAPPAYEPGP